MQGIHIGKEGKDFSAPRNDTVLSLLAEHDNVEIMLQTIKSDVIMWIAPSDDMDMMEFFYIVSGTLVLQGEAETVLLGENDYFYVKGLKREVLLKSDTPLKLLYITSRPLYDNLENFNCDLNELLDRVNEKDQYTEGHSRRVMALSVKISEKLQFVDTTMNNIAVASLFHDVGKCFVPDSILKKSGKLEPEDWPHIFKHPVYSRRLLEGKFGKEIAGIAQLHHERLDGSGYPYGLKQEDIPLESKIIAVADSFDAMTTNRSYSKAKTRTQAIEELSHQLHLYDPEVVKALKEIVENNEID